MRKKVTRLKIQKYILNYLTVFSLIVGIACVFYFGKFFERLILKVIERQYYEKIELTTNVLIEVEKLHRGCTPYEKDSLFNNFIITVVEEIDKQYGIYARVIDLDGNQLSRAFVAEGEEGGLAILLDADDFDFDKDLYFLKEFPTGDRNIVSRNDVKIHLYWMRYPTEKDHYYYILLGIVYDRVIDTVDYKSFSKGLAGVMMSLLISFFVAVYLSSKNSKLRNILQRLRK